MMNTNLIFQKQSQIFLMKVDMIYLSQFHHIHPIYYNSSFYQLTTRMKYQSKLLEKVPHDLTNEQK